MKSGEVGERWGVRNGEEVEGEGLKRREDSSFS
jgi:hypothetical protein